MGSRSIALLLVILAGCTLTTSLDGLSGGVDETIPVEAGTESGIDAGGDATTATDASRDAASEAGSELYPAGGFETGSACAGTSYNSNLTRIDQNPHGGSSSCKLCGRGTNASTFSFDQNIPDAPVVIGGTYRATAWVRRSSADPGPTDVVSLVARSFTMPGFTPVENAKTDIFLGSDWKFVSVDFVPTRPADAFDVFVSANYEPGTCFVVDDITFVRIK